MELLNYLPTYEPIYTAKGTIIPCLDGRKKTESNLLFQANIGGQNISYYGNMLRPLSALKTRLEYFYKKKYMPKLFYEAILGEGCNCSAERILTTAVETQLGLWGGVKKYAQLTDGEILAMTATWSVGGGFVNNENCILPDDSHIWFYIDLINGELLDKGTISIKSRKLYYGYNSYLDFKEFCDVFRKIHNQNENENYILLQKYFDELE